MTWLRMICEALYAGAATRAAAEAAAAQSAREVWLATCQILLATTSTRISNPAR